MLSRKIEFEKLLNTRDLGGMTGSDGRKIKPRKLYRSGHLSFASENDLKKLSGLIELSVDFRTDKECAEKPEPSMADVVCCYNPIFEEQRAGVTRDQDSFAEVLKNMLYDSEIARRYMSASYEGFITNKYSVGQYERFIRMLLQEHQKGVLWHCTAGKDRTGFATVIIQELLGVSRDDIREDYLLTNACLKPETLQLIQMVLSKNPQVDPGIAEKALSYVFEAHIPYLDAAYAAAEREYGSFGNYLTEALHITPADREKFRDMYLE